MALSKATTVDEYLADLPDERRTEIARVRRMIKRSLPKGYREMMSSGMIAYSIPLETYPDTYNKQPLCYVALAAQKNYNALYLMGAYAKPGQEAAVRSAFAKAGKKLDMGKSCIRFKQADDLPLDQLSEIIRGLPAEELIELVKAAHRR